MAEEHRPGSWWMAASGWSWRVRAALIALPTAAYFGAMFALPPGTGWSLSPINLLLAMAGGVLLGFRAALAYCAFLVVANVAAYEWLGIFAPSSAALARNLLACAFGLLMTALVGRIRDLSLSLREEVQRRELAERRKEELTALLVHDLKNPLTGVVGHAELLAQPDLPHDLWSSSAEAIRDAGEEMQRMVMNLLDVYRAEDGKLQPRCRPVEVRSLVEQVCKSVRRQVEERRLKVQVVAGTDVGPLEADPDLVRRMLLNLVENAMRHSPPDRTIRIELGGDERELEMAVRDEGPGIPSGFEERIFEKWARLERDQGTVAGSNRGLGLAFCRLAAQAHGGRIWVEPSSPTGSVFRIRLPRGSPPWPPPPPAPRAGLAR